EKLEEFGIRRGASDNLDDYDDEGNITEEGTMRKLMELYPSLPENMQELIKLSMEQKDPIKESTSYYKEVQEYRENQNQYFNDEIHREISQSPYPNDSAFWSQYYEGIWRSNEYDMFTSKDFDLNDYID